MTTTSPFRLPPAPARPASPRTAPACPIELRALRSTARALADAVTGIALDAPCDRARQAAVGELALLLLAGTGGAGGRLGADVTPAAARVAAALPTFAADVSAGAPALAMACADLAGRLEAAAVRVPAHEHGPQEPPLACLRRLAAAAGLPSRVAAPWFLEAAGPAERVAVVHQAPLRVRRALRRGEDRHLRVVGLVRG
ncbi:hypothetical protein [Blastococcus sp. SYSU D00695]